MAENDNLTEEKIFESATVVFIKKGMDGTRMKDIADHAGINKALLHYYFRTKERLFNAVFEKIAGTMFRKFAPVFEKDLSLEDKIRFFFREHITFLQQNPGFPGFFINEINRNPERIKKLLSNIDIKSLWSMLCEQHSEELRKYNITEETLPQIMVSIASMSVFPFAARSILEGLFGKMGIDFTQFLEDRKTFAADFILRALKE